MPALEIVQRAMASVGLENIPSVVFTSTDNMVIQFRTLLNVAGRYLRSEYDWQALTQQTTFVTLAQEEQTGAIPDDFDHIVNDTAWNRTTNRALIGPMTPQQWQAAKAWPTFTQVNIGYRFRNDKFLVIPNPPAGQDIYYEYITVNWADTAADVGIDFMTADTDTSRIDETCLERTLVWMWKQAKGMDYAEDMRTASELCDAQMGHDGGKPALSLSRGFWAQRPFPNVPDGNWPG